ncbi:putative NAD(P)H dehydrogenase (quinone) FQR1-like 2, partial [Mucuna pruriens]
MGKGGGCIPSKKKALISAPGKSDPSNNFKPRGASPRSEKPESFHCVLLNVWPCEVTGKTLKKGVDSIGRVEGVLHRVLETLPEEVLQLMKAPQRDDKVPLISAEKLVEADGLLFGFPTRYGSMAAQMKAFFDSTGQLWREQKLAGVPAGFFVSTGTQGGGQETTIWTAITQLVHHGMLYVPIGYSFGAGMFNTESIRGGSPYGAGVFVGDGTRKASEMELALAEYQGKYMAITVKKLAH